MENYLEFGRQPQLCWWSCWPPDLNFGRQRWNLVTQATILVDKIEHCKYQWRLILRFFFGILDTSFLFQNIFIPGFIWGSCYSIFSVMCMFCRSLFVFLYFFLLAIVLSVLLRYTDYDYPFGIFKLAIKRPFILYRSLYHWLVSIYVLFVVQVLNYFHKQTLFRSASMLTTISTPVYPLIVTNGANDTTANMVTLLYRRVCLLN
jgi:hypothetical protein